jgi:hypothetical protein
LEPTFFANGAAVGGVRERALGSPAHPLAHRGAWRRKTGRGSSAPPLLFRPRRRPTHLLLLPAARGHAVHAATVPHRACPPPCIVHRRSNACTLLVLILHSKGAGYKGGAINTQDSAFTNTKAGVEPSAQSPLEHVPKRHKVSVVLELPRRWIIFVTSLFGYVMS